jgi:hypothetical protein
MKKCFHLYIVFREYIIKLICMKKMKSQKLNLKNATMDLKGAH